VDQRLFMYDCQTQFSGLLCPPAMLPPLAELPIRLPLLNFRALGSAAKDVYIQQW
jgi:hypothetical protein